MEYKILKFEEKENCLIITIDRPKALNALNQQTMNELYHFFDEEAKTYTKINGFILQGGGDRAFVAGADIKEFMSFSAEEGSRLSRRGHDIFNKIENFPKPVIAAVQGFALGGGCELAMACHMRVASKFAKYGTPEVNLGLIPGYGATQRMLRYVGKAKGIELLLTTDMIDGAESVKLGISNYVVEPEDLIPKSVEILKKIGSKSPNAVKLAIEAANAYYDKNVNGFDVEIENFGKCMDHADFREGVTAFLEKRKAKF